MVTVNKILFIVSRYYFYNYKGHFSFLFFTKYRTLKIYVPVMQISGKNKIKKLKAGPHVGQQLINIVKLFTVKLPTR